MEESKKHQVTSYPDIKKVKLTADHDFIINACDGIWDCFTNEQAAKFAIQRRAKGPSIKKPLASKVRKGGSPLKTQKMKSEPLRR